MNLVEEYSRQFRWRSWGTILGALPPLRGKTVLDLGCGIGDQSRELATRGAYVIGFDSNQEVISEAVSRNLPNCEFRCSDLRALPNIGKEVDGLWCSFTAAYLTDLPASMRAWRKHLRDDGWIALTEIDDLFGHHPLSARTRFLLRAYTQDAMSAGRYDFRMGRKLRQYLKQSGYIVSQVLEVSDEELSFNGPANPEVISAWRARFERMKLLRTFCGSDFSQVKQEFLACLARTDHFSTAKVIACTATACREDRNGKALQM